MNMRIIEWNCQGAFRLKNKEILDLKPDILIIPECEQDSKLQLGKLLPQPNDFYWYGDKGKKGIAVFSYSNYKIRLLRQFNPEFRFVIPLEVTNEKNSFLLFAIWAMDNKQNSSARYIGQIWKAINYYQTILCENSILIGDFNSNKIWDTKDREANHTDVVNYLKQFDIESLYHKQFNEEHGEESLSTFFMYRNIKKAYHIDYVFASNNIIKNGYKLTLESSDNWIDKSDHIPLILDINAFSSSLNFNDTFQDLLIRCLKKFTESTIIKFKNEISELEFLATKLDNEQIANERQFKFKSDLDKIIQIDELIKQLENNK